MFIDVSKNNGKDYLRLIKSKRVINDKGVKVPRNTVVLNIGSLEKFDDGQPDYLGRLRKSFRAGQPLTLHVPRYLFGGSPSSGFLFSTR